MTASMSDDDIRFIDRARDFAAQAHRTQMRRYTNEPYLVHLEEVANLCFTHGCDAETIAAAYLHDTIEDQPVTFEQIRAEFGRRVADMVQALTDEPTVKGGPNRAARKYMDRMRLSASSDDVQTIKCADMISNTSSIVEHDKDFARVYLREKRATLELLKRADRTLLQMAWESLIKAEQSIYGDRHA